MKSLITTLLLLFFIIGCTDDKIQTVKSGLIIDNISVSDIKMGDNATFSFSTNFSGNPADLLVEWTPPVASCGTMTGLSSLTPQFTASAQAQTGCVVSVKVTYGEYSDTASATFNVRKPGFLINSLDVPSVIASGAVTPLAVDYSYEGASAYSHVWSVDPSCGIIDPVTKNDNNTLFTAKNVATDKNCTLTVTFKSVAPENVTDNYSKTFKIMKENLTINSISMDEIWSGQTKKVTIVTGYSGDESKLSYLWSDNCSGSFDNNSIKTPRYKAPVTLQDKNCKLTAKVKSVLSGLEVSKEFKYTIKGKIVSAEIGNIPDEIMPGATQNMSVALGIMPPSIPADTVKWNIFPSTTDCGTFDNDTSLTPVFTAANPAENKICTVNVDVTTDAGIVRSDNVTFTVKQEHLAVLAMGVFDVVSDNTTNFMVIPDYNGDLNDLEFRWSVLPSEAACGTYDNKSFQSPLFTAITTSVDVDCIAKVEIKRKTALTFTVFDNKTFKVKKAPVRTITMSFTDTSMDITTADNGSGIKPLSYQLDFFQDGTQFTLEPSKVEITATPLGIFGAMVYDNVSGKLVVTADATATGGIYIVDLQIETKEDTNAYINDNQTYTVSVNVTDGTENYPYLITDAADFEEYFGGTKYFKLANSITLSQGWIPVAFSGTLDGAGNTISNFAVDSASVVNYGLITTLTDTGIVKNLTIDANDTFSGSLVNAGIIAAINEGLIDNVTITGTVTFDDVENVGAITGTSLTGTGIIENSYSTMGITVNAGAKNVGGLAGVAGSQVTKSGNGGTIVVNTIEVVNVGGIAGDASTAGKLLKETFNQGTVTVTLGTSGVVTKVGGIAGAAHRIEDSYNAALITVSGNNAGDEAPCTVGGMAGYLTGTTYARYYVTGSIRANNCMVGGMAGGAESTLMGVTINHGYILSEYLISATTLGNPNVIPIAHLDPLTTISILNFSHNDILIDSDDFATDGLTHANSAVNILGINTQYGDGITTADLTEAIMGSYFDFGVSWKWDATYGLPQLSASALDGRQPTTW